ncbi:hypothetical protein ACFX2F_001894 [Malus domestica]
MFESFFYGRFDVEEHGGTGVVAGMGCLTLEKRLQRLFSTRCEVNDGYAPAELWGNWVMLDLVWMGGRDKRETLAESHMSFAPGHVTGIDYSGSVT